MRIERMRSWKVGLALSGVLAILAMGLVPSSADALLVNGSFEELALGDGVSDPGYITLSAGSGSLVGWEIYGDSVDTISTYWNASHASRSLDLAGVAAGGVRQSFSTVAGNQYHVTFDLAGNPFGSPTLKQLQVTAAGQTEIYDFDTAGHGLPDIGWVGREFFFTASGATTTLEFFNLSPNGNSGVALDNVSVVATPEPTTALLVSVGLLGLAAARRRNA